MRCAGIPVARPATFTAIALLGATAVKAAAIANALTIVSSVRQPNSNGNAVAR